MLKIEEYKGDYLFTKGDENNLREVWGILQPYMEEFVDVVPFRINSC